MKNYCVLAVLTVMFFQVWIFDAQAEDTNTLQIIKQLQRRIDELEQKVKVLEAGKPAEAQATDAQAKQRIADLDQKVKILERNRELDNEALEVKLKEKDSLFKTPAWVTSIRLQNDLRMRYDEVFAPDSDFVTRWRVRPRWRLD